MHMQVTMLSTRDSHDYYINPETLVKLDIVQNLHYDEYRSNSPQLVYNLYKPTYIHIALLEANG